MRTWAASAQARIHGGRGPASKSAFVVAVQTSAEGKPRFMRLTPIGAFTNQSLKDWAASHLIPTAHVVCDGLQCFKQVSPLGATHQRDVTGGGQAAQTPQLRWVNTVPGNLKTALAGTYHSFDHAKYGARYLAEFAYRFNRRFDLPAMVPRLLWAAAAIKPQPLKILRWSEAGK